MFNTTKSTKEVIVKVESADLTKEEKEEKSEMIRIMNKLKIQVVMRRFVVV